MNRIKELRKQANLTQEQLAKLLNVSKRTIISWEKSESSIKKENLKALSEVFDVSQGYLLGYTDIKKRYKDEEVLGTTRSFVPISRTRNRDEDFIKFINFLKEIRVILSDEQILNIFKLIESMNVFNPNNYVGDFLNFKIGTPIDERTFFNNMSEYGYSYMMEEITEEDVKEYNNLFKDLFN